MENLPSCLFIKKIEEINLYDYKSNIEINRNKIILEQNVISFLKEGHKEVHFSETSIEIDDNKVLMMMQSNCLMTEQILDNRQYRSILLFFSKQKLRDFLIKFGLSMTNNVQSDNFVPCFAIEKDGFIINFMKSLQLLLALKDSSSQRILDAKFEEIMLYLFDKYENPFIVFLQNSLNDSYELSFRTTIETNKYKAMSIEDIAFLCNMSISTFKRHFEECYNQTPGKWFKTQKLRKAKEILQSGDLLLSELHRRFGYENLSNFSTAFKKEFGINPSSILK